MPRKVDNQIFFDQHKTPIWGKPPIVIAWQFSSAENLGALLRVCDNFGINQVYFVGNEEDYKFSKIKRNATTAIKKVGWQFVSETELWAKLPSEVVKIALDTTSESVALNSYEFSALDNPFCLFLGNEKVGLDDNVVQQCDTSIHIPMIGNSFSMNVAQAASVAIYEAVRQCVLEN